MICATIAIACVQRLIFTRNLPDIDELVLEHFGNLCSKVLEHVSKTDSSKAKYISFFELVKNRTIEKCRDRIVKARGNLQGPFSEEISSVEWMEQCFDEVFLSDSAAFDLDFAVEERLFELS